MPAQELELKSRLDHWLTQAYELGASDIHLVHGSPPVVREHGRLRTLDEPKLEPESIRAILMMGCPDELSERFLQERNLDFAYQVETDSGTFRFRANYFFAGTEMGACFRVIPSEVPDFSWANFPSDLADHLLEIRNGLILFTGVAGSGKSTSLAMIIQALIDRGGSRIITIEDPIEYLFSTRVDNGIYSVVTQREVGKDVASFADGLKYGLRQDPDVILVGEIRDRDTAQIALSAAETGHLVLSTLHSRDAKGAISRYSDLFEANMQTEIRAQLALSLRAVVSQHLVPSSIPDSKRELAIEVLTNTSASSTAIRTGKLESIDNVIQTSGRDRMVSLDESIRKLMRSGAITESTARDYVSDATYLMR